MTPAQTVSLLRELRGLERLDASIRAMTDRQDEWHYALVAIDDRRRWCSYCLSLESPAVIAAAEQLYAAQLHVHARTDLSERLIGDATTPDEDTAFTARPTVH
jgi:hypothetical protein